MGKTVILITAKETTAYKAASKKVTVIVNPKTSSVTKISRKGKKAALKWKKISGVSGYVIQYSMSKKFKKKVNTITIKKGKTAKMTLKNLSSGKKYYVRIRTYKKVGKSKYSSTWSKVKTITK